MQTKVKSLGHVAGDVISSRNFAQHNLVVDKYSWDFQVNDESRLITKCRCLQVGNPCIKFVLHPKCTNLYIHVRSVKRWWHISIMAHKSWLVYWEEHQGGGGGEPFSFYFLGIPFIWMVTFLLPNYRWDECKYILFLIYKYGIFWKLIRMQTYLWINQHL